MRIKLDGKGERKRTKIGDAEILAANFVQHKSGNPFIQYLYKDLLDLLIKDMHNNVDQNYDNVLLAVGGEGSGKSSIMWNVCSRYDPETFDIEKSYTYDMDILRERFAENDFGNGVFWLDETTQVASNRDWNTRDNKDFVDILETMRSKKFLFAGCAPKLERVDVYLRDFRMRYLLKCTPMTFPEPYGYRARGYFELLKRDPQSLVMKHVGYGMYNPMPPEVDAVYQPLKEAFQERKIREIAERKNQGNGAKYKLKYEEQAKKNGEIMVLLHDRKILDDDQIMKIFGYDNIRSYQNNLSKYRNKARP